MVETAGEKAVDEEWKKQIELLRSDWEVVLKDLAETVLGEKAVNKMSECRGCGASIYWLKTGGGKWMPVDAETVTEGDTLYEARSGHISHFATCPEVGRSRKEKQSK